MANLRRVVLKPGQELQPPEQKAQAERTRPTWTDRPTGQVLDAILNWCKDRHVFLAYPSVPSDGRHARSILEEAQEWFNVGHGVAEVNVGQEWFTYLNLGDTYDVTVGYCDASRSWIFCSWGDWVEEQEINQEVSD